MDGVHIGQIESK